MELGFGLKNAGPLSQIGLQLISPGTAVALATGAYGWWKARERSQSLTEVLDAAGTALVPATSFDWPTYASSRKRGQLQGLVVQSGELQRATLPNGSTATPNDAGLACLRALITSLLCFHSPMATTNILCEILPTTMLHNDQEDSKISMEGPLLSNLKHFVQAVAIEEDNHTFRDYLLDQTRRKYAALTGNSKNEIDDFESLHNDDQPHVVGLLAWVLQAPHKRDTSIYPTRSSRVWLVACVLGLQGFQVSTFGQLCRTRENYEHFVERGIHSEGYNDIVLVTGPVGVTDRLMLQKEMPQSESTLQAQITPVKGVPWVVFRRLSFSSNTVQIDDLVDVWEYAFQRAREAAKELKWSGGIRHAAPNVSKGSRLSSMTPFQERLVSIWAPQLKQVSGEAMSTFIPPRDIPEREWTEESIRNCMEAVHGDRTLGPPNPQAFGNYCTLCAIMLGTVFGMVCQCVLDQGHEMNLGSEVAIAEDILYQSNALQEWARTLGRAIDKRLSPAVWMNFLLSLLTGRLSDEVERQPDQLVLGGNANGISVVSSMMVHPSIQQLDLIAVHIGRGMLLNIPRNTAGLVLISNRNFPVPELALHPDPQLERVVFKPDEIKMSGFRIDAEPFWEDNVLDTVFRIRYEGSVVGVVDIRLALQRFCDSWTLCECRGAKTEITLPASEHWQIVSLFTILKCTYGHVTIPDSERIVVEIDGGEVELLALLGTLKCRLMTICTCCLRCAYDRLKRTSEGLEGSQAIVIVNGARLSGILAPETSNQRLSVYNSSYNR